MSQAKLFIFDLDGTLLDSVPDLTDAANATLRMVGKPEVTEADMRQYVGNGADVLVGRFLSRSVTVSKALDPEFHRSTRELFDDNYEKTGHTKTALYPNVLSTLKALKESGAVLSLVTNKPLKFVPHVLEAHGIADFFADVFGGDSFETKKPDPVALNWLMNKYSVSTEETVMVGDSKNDVLAAKNAGCRSFALTYGYNHGEPIQASEPTYVADDISEMLALISVSA